MQRRDFLGSLSRRRGGRVYHFFVNRIFSGYGKFRRASNAWFSVAEMNIDRFLQAVK